ncbi:NAD(P)H-binding protein [Agrobacterium rosae]
MKRVFIVGGAGKVAKHLIMQLEQASYDALALHRKPEQTRELEALGATAIMGDLTQLTADELALKMKGCDVVVFTAGAGGAGTEVTNAIDGRGLEISVDAAQKARVPRFLLVSAFPDALRDGDRKEGFENYIRVKKRSDAYLVASDLEWVIVRPGTLSDAPGTGEVNLDVAIRYGDVPREDVATCLMQIIAEPAIRNVILELTAGSEKVGVALSRLVSRALRS